LSRHVYSLTALMKETTNVSSAYGCIDWASSQAVRTDFFTNLAASVAARQAVGR
jgi:hypothetical protein